jgi:superfamily II DNA or RNA helicase
MISALELMSADHTLWIKEQASAAHESEQEREEEHGYPAILNLRFPFELKPDQLKAVDAWLANKRRGSIIYSSGTGKTEIAYECARRSAEMKPVRSFKILILVPRIVLIEQNYKRLFRYGIPPQKIGRYFGEQKDVREITISSYQSAIANLDLAREADMVILDEVHLASGTAQSFSKLFDIISEGQKELLALTATIDECDPRNNRIMTLFPPARKYPIKDAVKDGRLAKPIISAVKVNLTELEQKMYEEYTEKIKAISARFKRYDAKAMIQLAKLGGFPSWQAKAWFSNVRKRKALLASADNKLAVAVELIKIKHPNQKVMVFSETLESIRKLKQKLKSEGIDAMIIDSRMPSFRRQKILSQWGKRFYPLLSVHTLEVGYDVPEVAIEILLSSTSNVNQIVQRVGRVIRKVEGKESALVYVIHVSDSRDDHVLARLKSAVDMPQ